MTTSLWFLMAAIALILVVDWLWYAEHLSGPDISQAIYQTTLRWPLASHTGYLVLVVYGYYHFFTGSE